VASVAGDTLKLVATDVGNGLAIFFEGPSIIAAGVPFGDGIRCTGGTLERSGQQIAVNRTATYPQAGNPAISLLGPDTADPGESKAYQAFYRSAAPWCNAATFNITSAYDVLWSP
jgi:hypothetical protein